MCAIFGLGFQNGSMFNPKDIKEVVKKLLVSCQIRGTHATGIAIANEDEVTVVKHNVRAEEFITSAEFHDAFDKHVKFTGDRVNRPTTQIIGHCRHQTKGTHRVNGNNHPIVCDRLIGTHNGIISNDEELYVQYSLRRKAEVDSEVIFQLIESQLERMKEGMVKAIQGATEKLSGSFACGIIDTENPWTMWMVKGSSPIDVFHYPEIGVTGYASVGAWMQKAIMTLHPQSYKKLELLPSQAMAVNLLSSSKMKFELNCNRSGTYHFC
ncbi:hypothetical protein DRN34_00010 [Thermococci archaeon]|nr:MAG: hypothetical protein DRN34_00010 [Thermococci archaeon]